jgi:hypothetical protein
MRWTGHVARRSEWECIYDFGGKARRKEITRRPRRRWEDNIKMDLKEIRYGGTDWIELAQDLY